MRKMSGFWVAALLFAGNARAQMPAISYEIGMLKRDVQYLASDALEGRRTGSKGEEMARAYLEKRYRQMDIGPWKGGYTQPFTFTRGRRPGTGNLLRISGETLADTAGFMVLPWSGNGMADHFAIEPFYPDSAAMQNVHFDWEKDLYARTRTAARNGQKGIVFLAPLSAKKQVHYAAQSSYETLEIPVAIYFSDEIIGPVKGDRLHTQIDREALPAANFAAYIHNGAKYTVVIGAHYDHLGYGEDGSSLLANAAKLHEIHNGADDNASGTAAVMMLAQRLRNSTHRKYNYLFTHFSGEELGLLGSKALVKQLGLDSTNTAFMINLDMVGRLNDSSRALTIGGVGTSPFWAGLLPQKDFKVVVDSSGIGPSDHSSFYLTGIPVLFFFTGPHADYHKPTDDAEKLNYKGIYEIAASIDGLLTEAEKHPKPLFTATRQNAAGQVRFKVTLGIMPNYSFTDGGVKVDGVTDGRPAAKAGVQPGDVLLQLGDFKIGGMQSYMEALRKLHAGQTVPLLLRRNGKEMRLPVSL